MPQGLKGFQKGNRLTAKRFCVNGHDTAIVGRDKAANNCKECRRQASKAAYRRHIDTHRNLKYKAAFGITLTEYNAMFAAQNGLCAGCHKHQTQFKTRLAVDHDHKTGKVRGLLCGKCNWVLGQTDDSQSVLQSLIDYLGRYGKL